MNADIQRYALTMPQYRETLISLQRILDFQASLADRIEPGLRIEPSAARAKLQAGLPLFAGESLPIPVSLFQEALANLRPLLPAGETGQVALDRLLASSQMTPMQFGTLLNELIADRADCVQRLADDTSAHPSTLAFLLNTALSPFFDSFAAAYRQQVESVGWRRGICPMCGSEPWMSRLDYKDGRRILACPVCRTEWGFDRLRCPFCESQDQPLLRHFTVDDDEAHRVDCCDRCQRYIKTVDERVSDRPANLLVEDVITAHLDLLAREQGYG
jgi:FdhE protein